MFIYDTADTDEPAGLARAVQRRWHAVGIVAAASACAAARACKDRRFLSGEAPRLPLEGCAADCCDCRYQHFGDRRRGPRRAEEKGRAPAKHAGADHRVRRGRRVNDHSTD